MRITDKLAALAPLCGPEQPLEVKRPWRLTGLFPFARFDELRIKDDGDWWRVGFSTNNRSIVGIDFKKFGDNPSLEFIAWKHCGNEWQPAAQKDADEIRERIESTIERAHKQYCQPE